MSEIKLLTDESGEKIVEQSNRLQNYLRREHARLIDLFKNAGGNSEEAQAFVLIVAQLDTPEGREFVDQDQFGDAYKAVGRILDRGSLDDDEEDDDENLDQRANRIFWTAVTRLKCELATVIVPENSNSLN